LDEFEDFRQPESGEMDDLKNKATGPIAFYKTNHNLE
jgi:hypothetical protein